MKEWEKRETWGPKGLVESENRKKNEGLVRKKSVVYFRDFARL